ncbi:hypothetical protein ACR42D_01255 [Desulfovibrio caledoniensis]
MVQYKETGSVQEDIAQLAQAPGLDPTASTGDSANVGMGKGTGSSAWVHNQTSIIGKEQVDIRVEDNTHVEGAVIAAENGNLKLDTDTLTYNDIHDHDKASNYQASLSVSKSAENAKNSANRQGSDNAQASADSSQEGASNDANKDVKQQGNPYSGTLDGSASSHDRRQINRATIGEGEIIIRSDPDAGLEGLNRDLAKAQEITRDEKTSVTVYVDLSAIDEVASGFKGIQENTKKTATAIKDLIADLKGKDQLTPAEMTWLKNGIAEELKKSNICGSDRLAEEIGGEIGDRVAKVYNDLRKKGCSNSAALAEIEKSFQAVGKWADESVTNKVAIKSVGGRNYVMLPNRNGNVNVVAGFDDATFVIGAVACLATIAILYKTNPELAKQLGDGLANTVESLAPSINKKLTAVSDLYASLTNQVIVRVPKEFGDGVFEDTPMDVLKYDEATGTPTRVKIKGSNKVYEVTYDPNSKICYLNYGQKDLVYEDGHIVEATHSPGSLSEQDKEENGGIPASTPTDGVDTSLPGSDSDADVNTGPITTPVSGEGSDSVPISEDQNGQVDGSGIITQDGNPGAKAKEITHNNPLTAKKGDVIATPDNDEELFDRIGKGKWKHKKSGAIYEKSTSTHKGKNGEWKVGLKKGKTPSPSKKITVDIDGTVLTINK